MHLVLCVVLTTRGSYHDFLSNNCRLCEHLQGLPLAPQVHTTETESCSPTLHIAKPAKVGISQEKGCVSGKGKGCDSGWQ